MENSKQQKHIKSRVLITMMLVVSMMFSSLMSSMPWVMEALAANSDNSHHIILSIANDKTEITSKHIECIEINSKNTSDTDKEYAVAINQVDCKGNILNSAVAEDIIEAHGASNVKSYIKMVDHAYKVNIVAYDNMKDKNIISNTIKLAISNGKFEEIIEKIDDINVVINKGDEYTLPTTVTAMMNTGEEKALSVKWDKKLTNTDTVGISKFLGTVEGYGKKVTLTLEIKNNDPNEEIGFENKELESVIKDKLGKNQTYKLTRGDLLGVTELTLAWALTNDLNISDLKYFENITELDLSFYEENFHLTPLKELTKLTKLNLYANAIDDISPLAGLTQLTELNLINNKITSIEPLRNLVNLKVLKLLGNPITDYSPVRSYYNNLENKDFDWDPNSDPVIKFPDKVLEKEVRKAIDKNFGDIYVSDVAKLKELNVLGVGVKSLSGLEYLTSLEKISLWGNGLEDSELKYLKPLKNLRSLDLALNRFTNIPAKAFEGMTNLEELVLDENTITTINKDAFVGLTNLKDLLIDENKITDISAVSVLTNLDTLMMRKNRISNIGVLNSLTKLTCLWADDNNISDITPLKNIRSLKDIGLENNRVSDISCLSEMVNMNKLKISKNQISNISAVTKMKKLTWLQAAENNIVDITPVTDLVNLDLLHLNSNKITNIDAVAKLVNLTTLQLNDNDISNISSLRNLTKLKLLHLNNNKITDYSPIKDIYSKLTNIDFTIPEVTGVKFVNPAVEFGVRKQLGKTNGEPVTEADLLTITSFTEGLMDKHDTSDFKYMKNLELLSLSSLSDKVNLEPIRELTKLKNLNLSNNTIDNISALSGLVNLEVLDLSNNAITDISPLKNLVKLTSLKLSGNKGITDYSPIKDIYSNLTIKDFEMPTTPDTGDGSTGEEDTAKEITFVNSEIEAIVRAKLKKADGDTITIGDMLTITEFGMSYDEILEENFDITDLKYMKNLEELGLFQYSIINLDLKPIKDLTKLRILDLNMNAIDDISALSGLVNLEVLDISANAITDISPLRNLVKLKTLKLSGNKITDYSPIDGIVGNLTEKDF